MSPTYVVQWSDGGGMHEAELRDLNGATTIAIALTNVPGASEISVREVVDGTMMKTVLAFDRGAK